MKIIIVGAGEVGYHFAEWLAQEKKEVVVIDINPEALRRVSDHLDVQILHGSGSNPQGSGRFGPEECRHHPGGHRQRRSQPHRLSSSPTSSPPLSRKSPSSATRTISDYREALTRDILNIGLVINPEMEVVNSILRIMSAPEVEEVNDFVGGRLKMLGKFLPPDSPLNGLKLSELPEKIERNRMIIAALVRDEALIIPKGKDTLRAGDFVYFVCQSSAHRGDPAALRQAGHPPEEYPGGGRRQYRLPPGQGTGVPAPERQAYRKRPAALPNAVRQAQPHHRAPGVRHGSEVPGAGKHRLHGPGGRR